MKNVVDLFGRCMTCGGTVQSTGGCQPCWQRVQLSEAVSSVLHLVEPAFPQVKLISDPQVRETTSGGSPA